MASLLGSQPTAYSTPVEKRRAFIIPKKKKIIVIILLYHNKKVSSVYIGNITENQPMGGV